jgi:hypothetical protein
MRMRSEDDVIGVCSECKSEHSDASMYKSSFAQNGSAPVCKYCGGVVIIVYKQDKDSALDKLDRERGI